MTNQAVLPKELLKTGLCSRGVAAFTLFEVMMSVAVTAIIFTGILAGYVQAIPDLKRSEHALTVLRSTSNRPERAQLVEHQKPVLAVRTEVIHHFFLP